MDYRIAEDKDLDLLAEWNHQLIRDEGHRNPMTVPELKERMKNWLLGEYTAIIFYEGTEPAAYTLFREQADEIYLRQFFVKRGRRRQGIGKEAIEILMRQIWNHSKRLTVEVLCHNHEGIAFWKAVGYKEYCLTLEKMPEV
jgi:GNAT superfamily N-acetyltransferase